MSFPSKFTRFDKSILAKIGFLFFDEVESIGISDLMQARLDKFDDIGEFILALDVAYVLGKIEVDEEKRMIKYVDRNPL